DVQERQTANAAQALCDALDSQNIDDMYVKASFFVVGKDESFTISEIPTTIAQGETLTISGVSTANADGTVTVEMISTAFAAVPKETVGSAAFIAVSTKVADDGTWEITMDTSDLNVDEYSLKVAVTPVNGETETWKNVNINVVEGADTPDTPDTPDVPDTPDTPDTPTEPETPGFGALAALAGLGAVAVLLLRRE
ncbi:PGF-CTERM sorting domain-containing protein, partial [Methanocorpusculum sp.]|nr:PGF-CTERM sorting domain-containing protein [Methanocorpusculum sp.]